MTVLAAGEVAAVIPTAMALAAALPYAFLGGPAKRQASLAVSFVVTLLLFVAAFAWIPFSVGVAYWTTVAGMVASVLVLSWSLAAEAAARRASP